MAKKKAKQAVAATIPLDFETATHCSRCNKSIVEGSRTALYNGKVCVEVICGMCASQLSIDEWKAKPELKMRLVLDATLAVMRHDEYSDMSSFNDEYVALVSKNIETYREIKQQFDEIDNSGRMTEIAVWFGRPDRATPDGVMASRKFCEEWQPACVLRKGQKPMDFGLTLGPKAVKTYYTKAKGAGHEFVTPDFKALMLGTAGRLLITLQDTRSEGDKEAKFNGANITLIFDEDSDHPRGGIQSLVGTKDECLALLKAFRESDVKFTPSDSVSIW